LGEIQELPGIVLELPETAQGLPRIVSELPEIERRKSEKE